MDIDDPELIGKYAEEIPEHKINYETNSIGKVEHSPAPQPKVKNETEEVNTIPKASRPLMPLPNGR